MRFMIKSLLIGFLVALLLLLILITCEILLFHNWHPTWMTNLITVLSFVIVIPTVTIIILARYILKN